MKILITDDHQFIVEDLKEELEEMLPDSLCIGTTEPKKILSLCEGHTGYAFQSYQIFASAFLEKPISTEKLKRALNNLSYPVSNLADEMIEQEYAGKAVVGKQIQKWREERGMTRQELADTLKVDRRTVYRWENAERSPDIPTYMRILKILGKNSDIV